MKHLFMISLSLLHLGMTYSSDPLEFTPYDLGFLTVLSTAVFASQSAACRVLSRWRRTQNLLLSGFTVANVLSLNLLLSPSFTDLPVQYAVTAIAGGQLTLYVLFDTMDVLPLFARGLPAVTTLATVTVSILAYASLPPIGSKAAPGTTSAPHIRLVSFESTPNVYIVAFDALAPRALLQKHLGIDSTAYLDVLDAHFRRFPNFFSDGPLTKESLSRFLALDKAYFATLTRREAPYGLFPGLTPSPFFEILTANGYETNTVYMLNSFGKRTGPFVDRHVASNAIGACAFVPKHLRASALFGYCRLMTLDALLTILRAAGLDPGLDASRPIDQLIGAMTQGLARPAHSCSSPTSGRQGTRSGPSTSATPSTSRATRSRSPGVAATPRSTSSGWWISWRSTIRTRSCSFLVTTARGSRGACGATGTRHSSSRIDGGCMVASTPPIAAAAISRTRPGGAS